MKTAPSPKIRLSAYAMQQPYREYATVTELRDALLASYPEALSSGVPAIRGDCDESSPAWEWTISLIRWRSDWWPALGVALQHAAEEGGDFARGALVDFLYRCRESLALLPWTTPIASRWPDVPLIGYAADAPAQFRLSGIVARQTHRRAAITAEGCRPPLSLEVFDTRDRSAVGTEPVIADEASLRAHLDRTARRGPQGKAGIERPWTWLSEELRWRDLTWLWPALLQVADTIKPDDLPNVCALLDWLDGAPDLWRFLPLLKGWQTKRPSWWKLPSTIRPKGWRFPISRANGDSTLGDVACRALEQAEWQAAGAPVMDLPPLSGPSATTDRTATPAPPSKVEARSAPPSGPRFAKVSELRDALRASLPGAASPPSARSGCGAWNWAVDLLEKRSDWWAALGIALQHTVQDGGDPALAALADLLDGSRTSAVLLPWTMPLALRWPGAAAGGAAGKARKVPDRRLETAVRAQAKGLDGVVACGSGVFLDACGESGKPSAATFFGAMDLPEILVAGASAGRFPGPDEGPWSWMGGWELRAATTWLWPALPDTVEKLVQTGVSCCCALFDWFSEERDLWRFLPLLEKWNAAPPSWWSVPIDTLPGGWKRPLRRSNWPDGVRTLGDAARVTLDRAREQAAGAPVFDLPALFDPSDPGESLLPGLGPLAWKPSPGGKKKPAPTRVRLVLQDDVREEQLAALAEKNGWPLRRRAAGAGDLPAVAIYGTASGSGEVRWVDDSRMGLRYLLVKGPETGKIAAKLRKALVCVSSEDILARARDGQLGPEEHRRALYRLALDQPQTGFTDEGYDLITPAIRDDKDAAMRAAGVLCADLLGWPHFSNWVLELAGHTYDPDESTRRHARLLACYYGALGGPTPR